MFLKTSEIFQIKDKIANVLEFEKFFPYLKFLSFIEKSGNIFKLRMFLKISKKILKIKKLVKISIFCQE